MNKYVITKTMSRKDCSELMKRIDDEVRRTEKFSRLVKELNSKYKENRKSRFRGNKRVSRNFVYTEGVFKGIKFYVFKSFKGYYGLVYNVSPIDAPFVQFAIRGFDSHLTFVTQHLLDRYRERILRIDHTSYKELVIDFLIKTADIDGDHIAIDGETGKLVQKFNEGFIFGTDYEDFSVYNTIYDSPESNDNRLKSRARNLKNSWDKLDVQQKLLYGKILEECEKENISPDEFFEFTNKIFGDT